MPYQASKMELFAKIGNSRQLLLIFAKSSILDVWQGSEYTSVSYIFWISFSPLAKLSLNRVSFQFKITCFLTPNLSHKFIFWMMFKIYHQKEVFYVLYPTLQLFHLCHEILQLWDLWIFGCCLNMRLEFISDTACEGFCTPTLFTQETFTCSKPTIKALEKFVKNV